MPKFGNQSITVTTVTEDLSAPRDRYGKPAEIRTTTTVKGCRVRPLPAKEVTTDNGDRVTDTLKVTAPVVPAVVNMTPNDEIVFEGNIYQVALARVFSDLGGKPHKATIEIYRNLS